MVRNYLDWILLAFFVSVSCECFLANRHSFWLFDNQGIQQIVFIIILVLKLFWDPAPIHPEPQKNNIIISCTLYLHPLTEKHSVVTHMSSATFQIRATIATKYIVN